MTDFNITDALILRIKDLNTAHAWRDTGMGANMMPIVGSFLVKEATDESMVEFLAGVHHQTLHTPENLEHRKNAVEAICRYDRQQGKEYGMVELIQMENKFGSDAVLAMLGMNEDADKNDMIAMWVALSVYFGGGIDVDPREAK